MAWPRRGVLTGAPATPFGLGTRQCPCVVAGLAPLGIQHLGGPGHYMERIGAADRVRAALGYYVGDPVRRIGADVGDQGGPLGTPGRRRTGDRVAVSRPGAAAHTSRPLS